MTQFRFFLIILILIQLVSCAKEEKEISYIKETKQELEIATAYKTNKFELSFNSYLSLINNAISREFSQINNQDSILYDGEVMRVQMNKNIDKVTIYGFEAFIKSLFAN